MLLLACTACRHACSTGTLVIACTALLHQDVRCHLANVLGVQYDLRLFDHFFQNGIQMRLPHLWEIWTDWDQFRSFATACLQRWPEVRVCAHDGACSAGARGGGGGLSLPP